MPLMWYLAWHYGAAPRGIAGLLGNYAVAVWHRFLIGRHARTLFAPWHRADPSDLAGPAGIGDRIAGVVVDGYIRVLAAAIRLTVIVVGIVAEGVVAAAFGVVLVVWLLWPLIVVWLAINGLALMA